MTVMRATQLSNSIDYQAKELIKKINEAEDAHDEEGIIQIRVGAAKKLLNWIIDYKTILIESDVDINKAIDKEFGSTFLKHHND